MDSSVVIARSRRISNSDLGPIVDISGEHYAHPHETEDLASFLKRPNGGGVVLDIPDGGVQAYLFFSKHSDYIDVIDMCVKQDQRRKGLGTVLIGLVKKLLEGRRTGLTAVMSEDNMPGLLFFKSMGFRGKLDHASEDGFFDNIIMEYERNDQV